VAAGNGITNITDQLMLFAHAKYNQELKQNIT
jgi:hypothetical protein